MGAISATEASSSPILENIQSTLNKSVISLHNCRTAKLWLQYMEMINILREFIKGERMGNWETHLRSLHEMLPLLAASGHNLYTKSIHIYLQMMAKLPQQHSEVHAHFLNGLHVIRRSDRFWGGLSADLVIEQALMKNMKTRGGLTRGRGMGEIQRLVWLLGMPTCAMVNSSMQTFTGVTHTTSEQHKDVTVSRQLKDMEDTQNMITLLQSCKPFDIENSFLHSITTGITASRFVNVDDSKTVGGRILKSMVGENVTKHTF